MTEPLTLDTELLEEYLRALFANDYLRIATIIASCDGLNLAAINGVTMLLLSGRVTKEDFANGVTIEIAKRHLLN